MAVELIFVIGESGVGKSTSMRNLPPEDTIIIQPNAKNLPWPGGVTKFKEAGGKVIHCNRFTGTEDNPGIQQLLRTCLSTNNKRQAPYRNVIIEDFSHFFGAHTMSDAFRARNTKGESFQRYTDMAKDVYDSLVKTVETCKQNLPEDCDSKVVVINHVDTGDDGLAHFKTAGKLLDKDIKPETYVNIVLHAITVEADKMEDRFRFQTQKSWNRSAKSPAGMFKEEFIPNDLAAVLERVRAYDNGIVDE